MKDNFINLLEPTPKLHSKKCKIIATVIWFFLKFTIYITTLTSWYLYDFFIAFFVLILTFIIMGIVRSKLRNIAIPPSQQEYQYNDKGIADWFTAREICFEDESSLKEIYKKELN